MVLWLQVRDGMCLYSLMSHLTQLLCLELPLDRRRKAISPEYSLEGLMLQLKVQYFGPLMRRTDSLEKTLMLGKIEGRRRRGWQRMRWWDNITDSMNMSLSKLQWWTGKPGMLQSMGWQRVGRDWVTVLNWIRLLIRYLKTKLCLWVKILRY